MVGAVISENIKQTLKSFSEVIFQKLFWIYFGQQIFGTNSAKIKWWDARAIKMCKKWIF